jgi:protein-S-isoprenylcysteine O-methyltransferase Ste14
MTPRVPGVSRRSFGDVILFGVTAVECAILFSLTPAFTIVDWIYVVQNLAVLVIALTRRPAEVQDHSLRTSIAVGVNYVYPYLQVIYLAWVPGRPLWPAAGLVLVTAGAVLGLASLLALGRWFGVRPALRGLATTGPYRFVRHPLYLAHVVADIGYNLQQWNLGTVLLVIAGWGSLLYRIRAEERILAGDDGWRAYVAHTRSRLIPGLW